MTLPERLRYYILRDNTIVPLVPIDQLPFQLQDLPRQLTSCQMDEAGWKFVGRTQERPSMLAIQAPAALFNQPLPPTKATYLAPDHDFRQHPMPAVQELQHLREVSSALESCQEQTCLRLADPSPLERPAFMTGMITPTYLQRSDNRSLTPHRTQPFPRQKEYCDFWMRTGECNYADFTKSREGKGCIYKHEMPSDRNKLRELGFPQGVPRWYKEKTALAAAGGLNWLRRGMAQDSYERNLSDESPASLAFNPSKFINTRGECRGEGASKLTTVEPKHAPVEVEDLISFDDSPVTTPAPSPRASASSCSSFATSDPDILVFPPSNLLQTIQATILKGEARQVPDKASEDNSETQPINSPSAVSNNEKNAKLSMPHSKRRFRQQNTDERPASSNGLARSKHATGSISKKAGNPSKGGKCCRKSMGPQFGMTQRQRASHEKEKLKGHSTFSETHQDTSAKANSA